MTDTTTNPIINPELQMAGAAAVAIGAALVPLAGPKAALADALLTQGLQFWADYQAKKAAGTLTLADLDAMQAKVEVDLNQLDLDIGAAASA